MIRIGKLQILFVVIVLVFGGGVIVWFGGHYPVASVDGSVIWQRDVVLNSGIALSYWAKAQEASREAEQLLPDITEGEVESAVLGDLIERMVIRDVLVHELGEEVFANLLGDRLATLEYDASLKEAAESLYGVEISLVERNVFEPQATKDILRSKLLLRGENPEEWLLTRKKQANVKIFSPRYAWEEGALKTR